MWDAEPGSADEDRLDILVLLVEAYEQENYPIPAPDPIEMILHVLDARGLTRRDLEPFLGGRGRVSEVLNRRRPLSLEMIRRLQSGLGIPADVLVQSYEIKSDARRKLKA